MLYFGKLYFHKKVLPAPFVNKAQRQMIKLRFPKRERKLKQPLIFLRHCLHRTHTGKEVKQRYNRFIKSVSLNWGLPKR